MSGKSLCCQRWLAAILLLAFLPTLTFLGHWDGIFAGSTEDVPAASTGAIYDLSAQQAEQTEHAQHCHTNLGSCSAQPMPAGIGLLATHEDLLGSSYTLFLARLDAEKSLTPRTSPAPLLPPPRAA